MNESGYDYYGYDATVDGIYSVKGGKMEHPRSLMSQSLSQRLFLSHLLVVVLWRKRLPGEKLKPTFTLVSCIEKLVSVTKELHYIYIDSEFAVDTAVGALKPLYHSMATIFFNRSFDLGM